MLHKNPKPTYRKLIKTGAKIFFVAEAIAFVGSYGLWYKLNTDRDFRLYMHQNYSSVLNTYYKIGEVLDSENKCRNLDLTVWQQEGKISN